MNFSYRYLLVGGILAFGANLYGMGVAPIVNKILCTSSFDFLAQEINNLDQNAVVIFDIDETLFTVEPKGGKSAWIDIYNRGRNPKNRESIESKLYRIPPLLADPSIVSLITTLQAKGVKVIALTACAYQCNQVLKDPKGYRITLLNNLGVHFEKSFASAPLEIRLQTDFFGNTYCPCYYHGVIFSYPSTKGKALAAFLNKLSRRPSRIIFFDNEVSYVKDVARMANELYIPFNGFIYKGFKAIKKSEIELYEQKVRYFYNHEIWLSDEAASALCNKSEGYVNPNATIELDESDLEA